MAAITYHSDTITFIYYLLIPHPAEPRVLLIRNEGTWMLPRFLPEEHHFGVVKHINRAAFEILQLPTAVRLCFQPQLKLHEQTDDQTTVRLYVLDPLISEWTPSAEHAGWFAQDELPPLDAAQHAALKQWFDWLGSTGKSRPDWTQAGWFNEVADWLVDIADRMDMQMIAPVQQVRAWARSSTLYADTNGGRLYLKAVPPMLHYEPVITRVLFLRYPQNLPDVRAVQVERGWMLMRAFEGQTLNECDDIELWEDAVRTLAKIQVDMVKMAQSLVGLGVPDRSVDYLSAQVERLMANLPPELSDEEQTSLRRISTKLRHLCFELVDHEVPLSLVHGDLWSSNIVVTPDEDILFFDWSDASIAHPFFDLPFFLAEIEHELPHVPDARQRLEEAYLQFWTRYEPMSHLRQAYAIACVLGPLHQAVNYYTLILPGMDEHSRWEMANMLPFLLRRVLAALEDYQL